MDMNTIALIKGLAGNGGGGSSLPTNPAQDGTYALQNTVSSGTSTLSWASGGSSGGGVMYVTVSRDMALDKNLEEIQTALDGGKVVMVKRESPSDGVFYCPLINTASYPEDPYYGVTFFGFQGGQGITFTFSNTTSPTDPLVYQE